MKTWKSKNYYLYHILTMINELKMGILTVLNVLGNNFYVYAPIFKIQSSKLVRIVSETD